jgi:hypothetical protein
VERIVSSSERIEYLADGYGGEQGPAEGPLRWKEGWHLLFSDIHNNRRMKYRPGAGEHDSRRVTRQELDGSIMSSPTASRLEDDLFYHPHEIKIPGVTVPVAAQ